jgi:hypothetical protein
MIHNRAEILGRNVSRKPSLVGGVKGHNMNEISFPGSPVTRPGVASGGLHISYEGMGRLAIGDSGRLRLCNLI